ncbi:hypothetical protein H0H81_005369, partial [Sphagnurus paluster]
KQEDESLQTLINRVDLAMRRIKDLRPANFDIDALDSELMSMTLIRSAKAHAGESTSASSQIVARALKHVQAKALLPRLGLRA